MGKISELNSRGHTAIEWAGRDNVEVEKAQDLFARRVKKEGWAAFSVHPDGNTKIGDFDPEADHIILVPPIQGG